MGAYCPAPLAQPPLLDAIDRDVLTPTVHAMKRRRQPFRGVLYVGVMTTPQGPRVLEYNCRFGDPETQPLLMRLRTDLLDVLEAVVDDRLDELPAGSGVGPTAGGVRGDGQQGLPRQVRARPADPRPGGGGPAAGREGVPRRHEAATATAC